MRREVKKSSYFEASKLFFKSEEYICQKVIATGANILQNLYSVFHNFEKENGVQIQ